MLSSEAAEGEVHVRSSGGVGAWGNGGDDGVVEVTG